MLFKPSLQSTIRIKRSKQRLLNTKISQIKSIITKPKFFGGFAVLIAILPLLVFGVGYLKSVYAESQWTAEDFTYQDTTITGFSDSGAEKIKLIKTLYLPDKNPNNQNITAIKDFTILQDQDNPKAFMKKGITFLKLPAHIEIIGQEAFLDNKITNINLPTTTRIIQTSAFAQNQLTSLNLPDSITTIVNSSFRQNKITGTLTIPKDVTEIGEAAFADNQISTLVLNDKITAIDAQAFEKNKINQIKVHNQASQQFPTTLTSLGTGAFKDNQLASVTLPAVISKLADEAFMNNKLTQFNSFANLTEIGAGAFEGNQFVNVDLSTVTKIHERAFKQNYALRSVVTSPNLTTLGDEAFYNTRLAKINLPNTVTSIASNTFKREYGVKNNNYFDTTTYVYTTNNQNVNNYPRQGNGFMVDVVDVLTHYYIKDTTTKLREDSKLTAKIGTDLVLTDTTTYFKSDHYDNITDTIVATDGKTYKLVNTPNQITSAMTELNIYYQEYQVSNAWETDDFVWEGTTIKGFTEKGTAKSHILTTLTFPNNSANQGVTAIADRAFEQKLNKITKLKIPASLRNIGREAFFDNELTNIDFSEAHNLYIDQAAFYRNKLTKLNLPTGAGLTYYQDCPSSGWGIFASNPTLTEVTLPQDMTAIPGCFLQGTGIKSVTIPASVTTIGERAFQGAYYLNEDQKLTNLTFAPGSQLTTISEAAFSDQGLTTVNLPNTVTTIGNYAFSSNKLTTITLSESLTKLPYDVFANNKLTGVLLPNSITTIDQNAFRGNVGVPSVGNKVLLFTEKRDHNYSNSDYHVINANNIKVSYTQNGQVIKNRVLWRSDYKSNQFITIDNGYEIVPEKRFSHNGRLYVLENDQPVSVVVTEHTNDVEFKYRLTQGYKVNYYLEGTTSPVPGIDPSSVFHEVSPGSHQVDLPTVPNYAPVPGQNTTVNVGPMEMKEINIYYRGMVGYTVSCYIQDNQGNQTTNPVPGINPSVVTGSGLPGTDIDITHPTASDNYVPVAGQPTKATLQADPSKNNFRIYYQKRQANYTIKYVIDGTNQPVPGLTNVTGQAPVDSTVNIPHPDLDNYQVVAGQPNSFVVKADPDQNIITVRYRHKGVGYKISYVDQDGNLLTGLPTNPITGSAAIGSSVTINHPTVAGYQIEPNQPTNLVIKADANQNQVTIKYRRQAVSYKISYVDQDGNLLTGLPTNPITGSAAIGSSVTIAHPTVAGYQIEPSQPTSLVIKADANQNQVTIRYRKLVNYKISYVDQDNNLIASIPNNPITGKKPLGETVTIAHPTVAGYQIEPNQPTNLVIKADANQNQVTIKYRRQAVSYKISYVDQDGNLLTGLPTNPITGSAAIGSSVTINHPTVAGYQIEPNQPTNLVIKADANQNQVTVKYRRQAPAPTQVGYQVTYLLQGTNQPVPGINPHQINGQGLPGTKITIVYPVLEQYEPVDGQPTELTLQANAANNQLTVYYRQKPQQPTPNPDPTPTPNPNPDPTPTPQPQPTPGGNGQSQPNNNALLPPNSGFETKTASVITAVSIIMGIASALKLYASRRR